MVRYKVIQPSSIRFTTDKIASHFDNGLDLNTVIDSIGEGSTKPESIGGIRVFNLKGIYHTCDNKRLYILRSAQSLGYLDYISVSVVSPCEIDLNVVKSGRHGKWITFDDDHEPYVHWIEEWGFPRVVNRQISSSGSVRSQGSRKSSSEKGFIDANHTSREHLIPRDGRHGFSCCVCLTGDDYDEELQQ